MHISWQPAEDKGYVIVQGDRLRGATVKVWYVELYMGPESHSRWPGATIQHTTRLVDADTNGQWLKLRCALDDGVLIDHEITVDADVIDFRSTAANPSRRDSDVAWGAPCVIVDDFTGGDAESYLSKCFIFLNGQLARLPVEPWARHAVETPGQVWCPRHVNRADVEPHPLSELVPDNGLIGCFSADEECVMAIAWEPYQNLFQGIITCLHADFGINGLPAGESKRLRGRIYFTEANIPGLLDRYRRDFPEHDPSRQL